jgi:hypothetical protein
MSDSPPPADDRPWEQPGAFRRDCEPHRGFLLGVLGQLSVALGLLAAFCFVWVPLSTLAAFLALGFGVTTWQLARHDLREMDAGRVDPAGRIRTTWGRELGKAGAVLAFLGLLATIVFVGGLVALIRG